MSLFLIALVLILGLCVGSFVNVLIDRSITGEDWVRGRSKCDYCGKQLAWYDNIPLLSFILYRGRTRCCRKRLSWKHPIVEGLFSALFVWWLLVGFLFFKLAGAPYVFIQPVFWLGIGITLLILALADLYYGVILMGVMYFGVVWTLLYRLILWLSGMYGSSDFLLSILAGCVGYGFLWLLRYLTKGKGMGDGDPYLAFLTCMLLGWQKFGVGMLLAFVIGAIVGSYLLLTKSKKWRDSLPFGPFLITGAVIGIIWGESLRKLLWGF